MVQGLPKNKRNQHIRGRPRAHTHTLSPQFVYGACTPPRTAALVAFFLRGCLYNLCISQTWIHWDFWEHRREIPTLSLASVARTYVHTYICGKAIQFEYIAPYNRFEEKSIIANVRISKRPCRRNSALMGGGPQAKYSPPPPIGSCTVFATRPHWFYIISSTHTYSGSFSAEFFSTFSR